MQFPGPVTPRGLSRRRGFSIRTLETSTNALSQRRKCIPTARGVRGFPHFVSPWIIWGSNVGKGEASEPEPTGVVASPAFTEGQGMVQGLSAPFTGQPTRTCVIIIIIIITSLSSLLDFLLEADSKERRGWSCFLTPPAPTQPHRARPWGCKLRKCSHHGIDFFLGLATKIEVQGATWVGVGTFIPPALHPSLLSHNLPLLICHPSLWERAVAPRDLKRGRPLRLATPTRGCKTCARGCVFGGQLSDPSILCQPRG